MAEQETPQGDENNTPQGEPVVDGDKPQETDWKAEARKHEARSKEWAAKARAGEEAARRLAEIEEESKTEAQKTADRLAKLEAENAEFKQREQQTAWRNEVAEATGVPAGVLRGATLEEIQAHAETLKPLLGTEEKPEPDPKHQTVPTIGQTPQTPGNVPIADQIATAEKAGDRELVATLKALQLGAN